MGITIILFNLYIAIIATCEISKYIRKLLKEAKSKPKRKESTIVDEVLSHLDKQLKAAKCSKGHTFNPYTRECTVCNKTIEAIVDQETVDEYMIRLRDMKEKIRRRRRETLGSKHFRKC